MGKDLDKAAQASFEQVLIAAAGASVTVAATGAGGAAIAVAAAGLGATGLAAYLVELWRAVATRNDRAIEEL